MCVFSPSVTFFLPFFTLHSYSNTIAFYVVLCSKLVVPCLQHTCTSDIYIWISSVTTTIVTVIIMA